MYTFFAQLFSFVASPLTYIFILIGIALLFYKRKKIRVVALVTVGALILFFTNSFIYYKTKQHLTEQYTENIDTTHQYRYGIILGGGVPNDSLRRRSEFDNRIVAAVMLYKKGIIQKVVYSGMLDVNRNTCYEQLFRDNIVLLGVKNEDFILEPLAQNTKEHPVRIKELVGIDNLKSSDFIIITSALHTKRALKIFNQEGLSPLYYSTDTKIDGFRWTWKSFLPNFYLFDKWTEILHEQIGIIIN